VLKPKQGQISFSLSAAQDTVMAGSLVNVNIVAPDVIPAAVYLASRDVYPPAMEATQALETQETPLCDPDQIDGTFTFASLPAGKQTISFHFQNKGNAACRLQGQAGASFAVDGHSMTVARCWLCELNYTPSLLTERQPGNQILLAPGERATLALQWASTGEPCQWADWVDFSIHWSKPTVYLFVPSDWPLHICSAVKSAGYLREVHSPSMGVVRNELLRVSVTPTVIYSDEYAVLHAELVAPTATAAVASSAGCASLYSVRHGPSVPTRFEPLGTIGLSSRPSSTPEEIMEDKERGPSWKANHQRRCIIADGLATADAPISAADLVNLTHLEWRTAPGAGEEPVFLTAATHFSVLDVDTLEPNWGDPAKGIRVGLSIDRERYRVGERVPLHLRWENVNAAMPLAEGECKEPKPDLEIQDSQHNVVRTIPNMSMCTGHGWGPFTIQKGKAQRTFIELATAHPTEIPPFSEVRGELPGPGVYYLVSVWSPRVLESDAEPDETRIGSGHVGKVYATARSLPVRIEVESK
jgi:hypothetical protein